jgi:hypothetical protein
MGCAGGQSKEEANSSPTVAVVTLCELGFTPVLLQGLPDMTNPEFTYLVYPDDGEINLKYTPLKGSTGLKAPHITVFERAQAPTLDPPNTYEAEIDGTRVLVDEYPGASLPGRTTASFAASWSQGGVWVSADFAWLGDSGDRTVLSDEMRQIALSVVEATLQAEPPSSSPLCSPDGQAGD